MLTENTISQPFLQWASIYSGGNFSQNEGDAIKVDKDLNVYVTGYSRRYNDYSNYIIIKYNSNGDSLWERRYDKCYTGYGCDNFGVTIDVDNLGNVYSGGQESLIKYDNNGNLMWVVDSIYATKLIVFNNQFIYLVGKSINPINSAQFCKTCKFDLNGNLIWSRIYGNNVNNAVSLPYDMTIDNQGNILITGERYETNLTHDYDFITIKYDSNGDSLWNRRYDSGFNKDDFAYGIAVDSSNNIFVTGKSYDSTVTACYLTIKYDPLGNTLWARRYNINASSASDIAIDRTGNIFVTGTTCNGGCYTTIKYSNSGTMLWSESYVQNTTFAPAPNMLLLDSLGNIYVSVEGATAPDTSALRVIKYNSNGNLIWTAYHYGGPGETTFAMALDKFNSLYATGIMNQNLITAKFSQTLSNIETVGSNIPIQYGLYQNYPNPFNPSTKIKFNIPKSSSTRVTIYDISGQKIADLLDKTLVTGQYEVTWNASDYPSGIYFCKITAGDYEATRKLVLLK